MSSKQFASASESSVDELKQDLDEDLSQVVHEYQERGLSPSHILDSMLWHAEVTASRSEDEQVEVYNE